MFALGRVEPLKKVEVGVCCHRADVIAEPDNFLLPPANPDSSQPFGNRAAWESQPWRTLPPKHVLFWHPRRVRSGGAGVTPRVNLCP